MADKKEWAGGEVLFAGGTDFAMVGVAVLNSDRTAQPRRTLTSFS
jgi:hypothetical protein